MTKISEEHAMVSYIKTQRRINHKDYQNCLFACFLSQIEPKKVNQALTDPSWIEAMQEELLQFKLQKSAFLYGTIEEEVYICQPPGFEDPQFLDKVYKVEKLYMVYIKLLKPDNAQEIQMSSMGELAFFIGLQVQQKNDGIFISQDKYMADILKKFDFVTVKRTSTPMDPNKALVKDEEAENVDVHLYRSMVGSLMYLIASWPDITFVVCVCAMFQVTPKVSHLHAVKRIFRYLKGQSKLGLWYLRDSPFDLEAFSNSDYAGASLDRKSTTGGEANDVNMQSRMDGRTCNIKQKCVMSQTPRQIKRGRDTKIPQSSGPPEKVGDEAVHKELGDRMERAATTTSSLEAEQDSGNINRTQSMETLNEPSP
ncbi:uncharacterized mitochondrial protein-like protein [Tanacetum coccineum]